MMQNKAIMAEFKVLSWDLPGGTKKNAKNLSQNSRFPGQDLTWDLLNMKQLLGLSNLLHFILKHLQSVFFPKGGCNS